MEDSYIPDGASLSETFLLVVSVDIYAPQKKKKDEMTKLILN